MTEQLSTTTSHNSIVFLISPPRSCSTALMRSIGEGGGFTIFHEPLVAAYNRKNSAAFIQDWYRDSAAKTYQEGIGTILQASELNNVLVKEMSFSVRDMLKEDKRILSMANVYFIFLLRNPHHSIISCYTKLYDVFEIIKDQAHDFFGYTAAAEIYNLILTSSLHPKAPHVVIADHLCSNPYTDVQKICDYIGIQVQPKMFNWEPLNETFDGVDVWNEIMPKENMFHWNGDAIRSSSFYPGKQYELDPDGNPTFTEIKNEEHRNLIRHHYQEQKLAYDLLVTSIMNKNVEY